MPFFILLCICLSFLLSSRSKAHDELEQMVSSRAIRLDTEIREAMAEDLRESLCMPNPFLPKTLSIYYNFPPIFLPSFLFPVITNFLLTIHLERVVGGYRRFRKMQYVNRKSE